MNNTNIFKCIALTSETDSSCVCIAIFKPIYFIHNIGVSGESCMNSRLHIQTSFPPCQKHLVPWRCSFYSQEAGLYWNKMLITDEGYFGIFNGVWLWKYSFWFFSISKNLSSSLDYGSKKCKCLVLIHIYTAAFSLFISTWDWSRWPVKVGELKLY